MNPSTCPNCRNPIPADAPAGLCPSCALLGAAQPTVIVSPPSAAAREEVAAAFPELEILELLGQGGMGMVFKARQPRLDRLVALKILPPHLAAQPGFAERFTREARALARLNHPHIVTVYDFGGSGGFYYLLMEYVEGVNLRKAMQAGIKPEQAMLLVPKICEALQFAHDHGVLHRDIKPENILLDRKGRPKLADFGIAKLADDQSSGLTVSGAQLGTAAYMAPEQVEKPASVDHRADIYSLGVVFYEMLTGELPLGRFAAPSEKSAVGVNVDAVVLRALEKERERRQQSAGEMKTQVEGASTDMALPQAPPGREDDESSAGGMKHFFHVLTVLAGVGIPASAVVPGMRSLGLTPAVMVFVCAAFAVLSAMWPGRPQRRPQPARPTGRTRWKSESRSNRVLFGYPLWHFVHGPDPATGEQPVARGILAMGPEARGFVAIGGRAHGVLAFGGLATGVVALGGMAGGLITAGGLSLGLLAATGGLACGGLARGGVAVGYNAEGGFAIGHVAKGGKVITDAPGPPDALALQVTEILITAAQTAGVLALLAGMVVWQMSLFARPGSGAPEPGPRVSRGFLSIVLVLLMAGVGVFLARFIGDRMSGRQTAGSYQTSPAVDVVHEGRTPSVAKWSQGTAELLGVSRHRSSDRAWWRMDGRHSAEGPFELPAGSQVFPSSGQRAYEFVFRLRDLPAAASGVHWLVEEAASFAGGGAPVLASNPAAPLSDSLALAVVLPASRDRANIKLGLAAGTWKTLTGNAPGNSVGTSMTHGGEEWRIAQGTALETAEGSLFVTYTNSRYNDWQARVIAVRPGGEEVSNGIESRVNDQSEWRFSGLKLADVKEFRFQVRRFEWVEFRGIPLTPLP
jgi:tRNA A-37 threonylcarbamoyl transferase component Bud32